MAFRPTLAVSLTSFVLAAGFLGTGWYLPPGNLAFPSGIALAGVGLLGLGQVAAIRTLAQRVEKLERLLERPTSRGSKPRPPGAPDHGYRTD